MRIENTCAMKYLYIRGIQILFLVKQIDVVTLFIWKSNGILKKLCSKMIL